jgi:hypothetical protein
MNMKRIALATLLAFTMALISPVAGLGTAAAQGPAPQASTITVPITGTGGGGTFAGTFTLQRFANQAGQVVALGVLSGTLTAANGTVTSVIKNVALPAAIADATCQILHLDLGPLSLDILGLQVNLSRVVLDITAQSGAGNLLGNLLCGVANLLNNPNGLVAALNNILGSLFG